MRPLVVLSRLLFHNLVPLARNERLKGILLSNEEHPLTSCDNFINFYHLPVWICAYTYTVYFYLRYINCTTPRISTAACTYVFFSCLLFFQIKFAEKENVTIRKKTYARTKGKRSKHHGFRNSLRWQFTLLTQKLNWINWIISFLSPST